LQGLAQEALKLLDKGEHPSPSQLAALEEVIRSMRPSLLSKAGQLPQIDPEIASCFKHWDLFCSSVRPFIYSIGRIDMAPDKGVGTGFLVAPDLLVTNEHVLDYLSKGTYVLEKGQAIVRFKYEYGLPDDEAPVPVIRVRAVHPSLDMALLQLDNKKLPRERPPLTIDPSDISVNSPVVAIGYPFNDPERNPLFIGAVFGNQFGVKRAAPGEIIGTGVDSVYHDCSTLGGNAGSPILSMKTASVVGIHKEGRFRYRNGAVNAAALDDFVKSHLNG
jgi:S1-C subfamily serine protease